MHAQHAQCSSSGVLDIAASFTSMRIWMLPLSSAIATIVMQMLKCLSAGAQADSGRNCTEHDSRAGAAKGAGLF